MPSNPGAALQKLAVGRTVDSQLGQWRATEKGFPVASRSQRHGSTSQAAKRHAHCRVTGQSLSLSLTSAAWTADKALEADNQ